MTRKEFEELKDQEGYDLAINQLYVESKNPFFLSYPDLKTKVIELVRNNKTEVAERILNVVNNPPELDCGFYYYDEDSNELPINLDNADLIEKYIGFAEPTNLVTVHIAVLDYCSGCIKKYTHEFNIGWQTEDVETWLEDNTDYKDSQCYYMASKEPIEVIEE